VKTETLYTHKKFFTRANTDYFGFFFKNGHVVEVARKVLGDVFRVDKLGQFAP
jgi:cytochrome P450 family 6